MIPIPSVSNSLGFKILGSQFALNSEKFIIITQLLISHYQTFNW